MHPLDRLALGLAMISVLTLSLALVQRLDLDHALSLFCLFSGVRVLAWTLVTRHRR